MEYEEVLSNLYKNNKLNVNGCSEYICMLKKENTNLKLKIMDLEGSLLSMKLKSEGRNIK